MGVPGHLDGGVPHAGQCHEGGAHLAEFDPVAVDLHLVVEAAQVGERAAGQQPDQVPGAVDGVRAVAEPQRAVALGGPPGVADVAVGDRAAADPQLAGRARGQRPQVVVEDVAADVVEGHADRHLGPPRPERVVAAAPGEHRRVRRLGRPVGVVQPGRVGGLEGGAQLVGQGLAGRHHGAQGAVGAERLGLQQQPQLGRHGVQQGHPVPVQGLGEQVGVALGVRRGDDQAGAGHQGDEHLVGADVEGEGRLEQHGVLGPMPKCRMAARTSVTRARWLSWTPLGRPVEPEVYSTCRASAPRGPGCADRPPGTARPSRRTCRGRAGRPRPSWGRPRRAACRCSRRCAGAAPPGGRRPAGRRRRRCAARRASRRPRRRCAARGCRPGPRPVRRRAPVRRRRRRHGRPVRGSSSARRRTRRQWRRRGRRRARAAGCRCPCRGSGGRWR